MLLMLYRSIQQVQALVDDSRLAMEEILNSGEVLNKQLVPSPPPALSSTPTSSASPVPSSPVSPSASPSASRSSFNLKKRLTSRFRSSSSSTSNIPTNYQVLEFSFHDTPVSKNPASTFDDEFEGEEEDGQVSPLLTSKGPRQTRASTFHIFQPQPGSAPSTTTSLTPTLRASSATPGEETGVLKRLLDGADNRYHQFVTACATLLSLIPEGKVVSPLFDEQVSNSLQLTQALQKYLRGLALHGRAPIKSRLEKALPPPADEPRWLLWPDGKSERVFSFAGSLLGRENPKEVLPVSPADNPRTHRDPSKRMTVAGHLRSTPPPPPPLTDSPLPSTEAEPAE